MFTTGPSLHTHTLPSVVFSTQQRHAPSPQAILFSKDTSHSMPFALAYLATAAIIGFGPQVAIRPKATSLSTEWFVTKPFSPIEPSSVVTHTRPYFLNSSSRSKSFRNVPREEIQGLYRHRRVSCRNTAAEPHLRRLQQAKSSLRRLQAL